MRSLALILLLAVSLCAFGCDRTVPESALQSPTAPIVPPQKPPCKKAAKLSASAFVFKCKGLGAYPDTSYGQAPTNISTPLPSQPKWTFPGMPELQFDAAITETDADGSVEAYLYPFTLFPSGSRWEKYQLKGTLLCADVNGSTFGARFQLHTTALVWMSDSLKNTEEARNLPFPKKGTNQGARLLIGETDGVRSIVGAHMTLPGKAEVWLSGAEGL